MFNFASACISSSVCRSAYFRLFNIGRVRTFLDHRTAQIAVHALVTSQLDFFMDFQPCYSCSVLTTLVACRLLNPVELLSLTYKAPHNEAPAYITDMLTYYEPHRALLSEGKSLLDVPPGGNFLV